MSDPHKIRLLPWGREDGKPCYLSTDNAGGYVSRLADTMEAAQLEMATTLIDHASVILAAPDASPEEIRYLADRLVETLANALRIAESRRMSVESLTPDAVIVAGAEKTRPKLSEDGLG